MSNQKLPAVLNANTLRAFKAQGGLISQAEIRRLKDNRLFRVVVDEENVGAKSFIEQLIHSVQSIEKLLGDQCYVYMHRAKYIVKNNSLVSARNVSTASLHKQTSKPQQSIASFQVTSRLGNTNASLIGNKTHADVLKFLSENDGTVSLHNFNKKFTVVLLGKPHLSPKYEHALKDLIKAGLIARTGKPGDDCYSLTKRYTDRSSWQTKNTAESGDSMLDDVDEDLADRVNTIRECVTSSLVQLNKLYDYFSSPKFRHEQKVSLIDLLSRLVRPINTLELAEQIKL